MMNKTKITALITSLIGAAFTIFTRLQNQAYWSLGIGMLDVVFLIGFGLAGVILCCWKNLVPVGQGLFIGIGITVLIGFSVCTFT